MSVPDPNLYLFDLVERLQGSLIPFTFGSEAPIEVKQDVLQDLKTSEDVSESKLCSYCGPIPDTGEPNYLQIHYKKDYHRYNIKRKLMGLSPLDEKEFEKVIGELDESISGSEESEEEDEKLATLMEETRLNSNSDDYENEPVKLNNTPYYMFQSKDLEDDKVYAFYKNVFGKKFTSKGYLNPEEESVNHLEAINELNANGTSAIFMVGGGHFSAGIIKHKRKAQKPTIQNPYSDIDVIAHKTFHRYTTRRKQGGAQSTSDNQRGKANSAGSSLRRHNEAALEKEIRELIDEWRDMLAKVDSIYIRANGPTNRGILMNYQNAPLVHTDPRIKSLPFTTKRATASEIKRSWAELTHAKILDKPEVVKKPTKPMPSGTQTPAVTPKKLDPNDVHTKELTQAIKKSKIASLISYLKKHKLDASTFTLTPESQYAHTPTLLHYAASKGSANIINTLLKTLKADPTAHNAAGKTPYQVASDRSIRDAFQLARSSLGPDSSIDWDAARVGKPLTAADITARNEAEKISQQSEMQAKIEEMEEQEKSRKQALIDRKFTVTGGKKLSSSVVTSTQQGNESILEMSPEDRIRFERERRARAIEARLGLNK